MVSGNEDMETSFGADQQQPSPIPNSANLVATTQCPEEGLRANVDF